MEGTNRKEMRKLLNQAIALMKVAFDNGLDMSVGTRLKEEDGRPWFTGYVYEEDSDFTDQEQAGKKYFFFSCYEWRDVKENEKELELVKAFIENHKK